MLSFPAYDCTQYDFGQVVAIEIPATVDLDTGTPSAFFDVKYPSGRTIRWSPVTIDETGDHPVAQYTLARGDLTEAGDYHVALWLTRMPDPPATQELAERVAGEPYLLRVAAFGS